MRALIVRELLPDFAGVAIGEVPTPEPGPGQVRVKVRAASVNFPDLLMTHGGYQLKPPLPFTPGLDLAGEIDALGDGVAGWKLGVRLTTTVWWPHVGHGGSCGIPKFSLAACFSS